MTPTTLARYIAHGLSSVEPFDLPALLDALRAERDKIAPLDDPPTIGEPALATFRREQRHRLDVVIAEVEHALTPPPKS